MKVTDMLAAGQLREAIHEATRMVRESPFDLDARSLLVECLILACEYERADKQLDTIVHQHPESMGGVSLLRQLIRAEMARKDFYEKGRVPEFVDQPQDNVQQMLRASIFLREGELPSASEVFNKLEETRQQRSGSCNGSSFEDFRDLDDRLGTVFEVLTTTGKYYWIPTNSIKKIEFRKAENLLDIKWRRAYVETTDDNLQGEVYIPGTYYSDIETTHDVAKLGRTTDWVGGENGPACGIGQKMFLVGEEAKTIMELETLSFE
ncbi:MAG: tetratricopeptide repeat protein [Gammaproteobacteria bacterium]|nr:tetratricopeptide repeat protein [Gammaproteobacteria bacterium]